eukprot:CAMPEP_0197404716 /NCGR_PEP_ID=MMETSP1165-20131217/23340_1 /TAXON_ID=284809 /ORGANISM="Chrysocystis fragilis, Strain CCMP3189" /LENGTH=158 /DNA_ID=CAMNT_0042930999 /DNA_START=84 /DNA_END=561 /DNA_ORIENTATION=+
MKATRKRQGVVLEMRAAAGGAEGVEDGVERGAGSRLDGVERLVGDGVLDEDGARGGVGVVGAEVRGLVLRVCLEGVGEDGDGEDAVVDLEIQGVVDLAGRARTSVGEAEDDVRAAVSDDLGEESLGGSAGEGGFPVARDGDGAEEGLEGVEEVGGAAL